VESVREAVAARNEPVTLEALVREPGHAAHLVVDGAEPRPPSSSAGKSDRAPSSFFAHRSDVADRRASSVTSQAGPALV
jgi:hypothetical protein